jgi:hypothetical protein
MLALFSTPAGMKPLALHRERWALRQFILNCRRQELVIDLQSLQYGASEARLRAMLREGDGWDIVHFSGHGLASSLSLEDDSGNEVSISAEQVSDLLHLTKARLKLVTLWSCESAESYVRDAKRALGIDAAGSGMANASVSGPSVVARDGLATRLMRNLGCRVVAMRYSVTDWFASELAKQFYNELFFQKNVVASALEFAKTEALGLKATPAIPALSSATPVAFGANALEKAPQITPPVSRGTPNWRTLTKMRYFDEEPRRFVGRGVDMAAATQALAVGSVYTGVVFTGMPGIGKSSCALELAYCHEHYFSRLAWWKATSVSSIQEFFQALSDQLKMRTRRLRNDADLRQLREEVAEGFRQSGVLLVIDELDVLLQPNGEWIDSRWGDVFTSLTRKSGPSRVVLTSESPPANPLPNVMIRGLEPLAEEEEYLLMRELPKIGTFFKDGGSAFDAGESTTDDDAIRAFLLQCRDFAGGLPGLWGVVDELAGEPDRSERLARLVSRAAEEDGAGEEADLVSSYRSRIQAWAEQAVAHVPEPSRLLFDMICLMEDSDRRVALVKTNWPAVWRRWHDREGPRPGHGAGSDNPGPDSDDLDPPPSEVAPNLEATLAPVQETKLVVPQRLDDGDAAVRLSVLPYVDEIGRRSPERWKMAVCEEMASYWRAFVPTSGDALPEELALAACPNELTESAGVAFDVGPAVRALPYLARMNDWESARALANQVLLSDPSPVTSSSMLPFAEAIAEAGRGSSWELDGEATLAWTLTNVDPVRADEALRSTIEAAASVERFDVAGFLAGLQSTVLQRLGRASEALDVVDRAKEYATHGGGPQAELALAATRLEVLMSMGKPEDVLIDAEALDVAEDDDSLTSQITSEVILDAQARALAALDDWQGAHEKTVALGQRLHDRGAPELSVARAGIEDVFALLHLERRDDARAEYERSQPVLARRGGAIDDVRVRMASAMLEVGGRGEQAMALGQEAVKQSYEAGEMPVVTWAHRTLGEIALGVNDTKSASLHLLAAASSEYHTTGRVSSATERAIAQTFALGAEPPALPAHTAELLDALKADWERHDPHATAPSFTALDDQTDDTDFTAAVELAREARA